MWRGVLFDLDGTLIDTAPDLIQVVNLLRFQKNMEALPIEVLRPFVSNGVQGLIGAALSIGPEHTEYEKLRSEFLQHYERQLCNSACLFPGIQFLLNSLEQLGYVWGIVTNKFERYAMPLIKHLELNPNIVVCGDTTANIKPHPEPLLYAIYRLGLTPEQCIYIGDDARDIQAGKAAGTNTIGITYGYGDKRALQAANFIADTPEAVFTILSAKD